MLSIYLCLGVEWLGMIIPEHQQSVLSHGPESVQVGHCMPIRVHEVRIEADVCNPRLVPFAPCNKGLLHKRIEYIYKVVLSPCLEHQENENVSFVEYIPKQI